MPDSISAAPNKAGDSPPSTSADRLILPAAAILLLSATSAVFAADAGLKDSGYAAAPAYDWTGLYFGGHAGYACLRRTGALAVLALYSGTAWQYGKPCRPRDRVTESGLIYVACPGNWNAAIPWRFVS